MTTIGTVEAKSHFSEMIERAASGEDIVITKRGVPVVKITSIDDTSAMEKRRSLIAKAQIFREGKKTIRREGESWNEIAREGQKW